MTNPQSLSMYNAGTLLGNMGFIARAMESNLNSARKIVDIFDTAVDMTCIDIDHGTGDYYSFVLLVGSYLEKFGFDFEWVSVLDLEYHGLYFSELKINGFLTGIRLIHLTPPNTEYFDVMYAIETVHNKVLTEKGIR